MTFLELLDLPRDLGDGLVLRWATAEDAEELAEFNFRQHNDSESEPEIWLKGWTLELMSGRHPTTGPQDVTVVVDENAGGKIVSAVFLISQRWSYDGIAFGCGMPEMVATDEDYRRRGLIRLQMEAIHALSEQKGELIQVIRGIPWYYRQFGYDMALDMGGGLHLPLASIKPLPETETEQYRLRPAALDDLPLLKKLYARQCENSLINCVRDDAMWRYEIEMKVKESAVNRPLEMIETAEGETIGCVHLAGFPIPGVEIPELVVQPGYSLLDICRFLSRTIKERIEKREPAKMPENLYFGLGSSHPAYEALKNAGKSRGSYAWYVRVPDLPRFLQHIQPVLERRLAESVMAGYSGSLKLNFYTSQLKITIEKGKITAVEPYEPEDFFDGEIFLPGLTFLQVLFGRRDLQELRHIFTDCFSRNDDSALLLSILFPKRSSHVINLN